MAPVTQSHSSAARAAFTAVKTAAPVNRARSTEPSHEVKEGESLSRIARSYQTTDGKPVTLATLKELNPTLERGRNFDLIYPGDHVRLPLGAVPVNTQTNALIGVAASLAPVPSTTQANTLTGAAAALAPEVVQAGGSTAAPASRTYVNPATGQLVNTAPPDPAATQRAADTLKQAFGDDNGLTEEERVNFNALHTPLAPADNRVDHGGNLRRGYESDGRGITGADQRAIDAGTQLDASIKQAAEDGDITQQEMLEINLRRVEAMRKVVEAGVVDSTNGVRGPHAR